MTSAKLRSILRKYQTAADVQEDGDQANGIHEIGPPEEGLTAQERPAEAVDDADRPG